MGSGKPPVRARPTAVFVPLCYAIRTSDPIKCWYALWIFYFPNNPLIIPSPAVTKRVKLSSVTQY